ncbi:hypothetical protein QBC47DRAFT_391432 [Echria macrotheca]|uniref:tRNA-splicing endonuclease subunit Sen15 domain-containing protein n=1 Tax=Echria macrotheca TaxID=438768 RepID=A0AAJ0F893_9PEZI|nr:hypothetical protein QBC47DRAFT_391432 [Echria macrotheca]
MAGDRHTEALAQIVLNNLENQHDWTSATVYRQADLPRPIIYGLPPKRLYVHPDEQIATIKVEKDRKERIVQLPEPEWVLPLHLAEKWSPSQFAAVFDVLDALPPSDEDPQAGDDSRDYDDDDDNDNDKELAQLRLWRGPKRGKRILLATVQDDSTVTYYFMHDGLVKPRQN